MVEQARILLLAFFPPFLHPFLSSPTPDDYAVASTWRVGDVEDVAETADADLILYTGLQLSPRLCLRCCVLPA